MELTKRQLRVINEKSNDNSDITEVDISEEKLTVIDVSFYDKDETPLDRMFIYNGAMFVMLKEDQND